MDINIRFATLTEKEKPRCTRCGGELELMKQADVFQERCTEKCVGVRFCTTCNFAERVSYDK